MAGKRTINKDPDYSASLAAAMRELARAGEPEPPDMGVLPPVEPTEDDVAAGRAAAIKVRDMMGLDPRKWNDAKVELLAGQVPNFSLRKITAKFSMVTQFKTMDQLERAVEAGRTIMEDPSLKENHIAAGGMVAKVAEAMVKMSDSLAALAVVAEPGKVKDETEKPPPRNLPPQIPQVNVQVNLNGANQPPRLPPAIPITGSAKPDIDVAQ